VLLCYVLLLWFFIVCTLPVVSLLFLAAWVWVWVGLHEKQQTVYCGLSRHRTAEFQYNSTNYNLLIALRVVVIEVQMAICNPSTKLSTVVHVGSLSGFARREDQTYHQQMDRSYELHGPVVARTSARRLSSHHNQRIQHQRDQRCSRWQQRLSINNACATFGDCRGQ